MEKKINVLFVRNMTRSFIDQDIQILQKSFNVKVIDFITNKKKIRITLKSILNLIKGVMWADVTFSWFADNHAYWAIRLSKIFQKKSLVVIGGYEVAKVPEMKYGLLSNPKTDRKVKYILKNATRVLSVSKFNENEILKYTTNKNIESMYNCVDCNKFKPGEKKKENLVITVAGIAAWTLQIKGLETFIRSAIYLPDTEFFLIGHDFDNTIEYLKKIAPPNVKFLDFIPWDMISKYYQRAKIYCQLSYRESFGMALAEAMACECIPIVTKRGALPEIAGTLGYYVPYGDEKATADAIKKALKSGGKKGARERIQNLFSVEKREEKLIKIINDLYDEEIRD